MQLGDGGGTDFRGADLRFATAQVDDNPSPSRYLLQPPATGSDVLIENGPRLDRARDQLVDVEVAMHALECENEVLKLSLLKSREKIWKRYFLCTRGLTLSAVFHCWRHLALRDRNFRAVEGFMLRHDKEKKVGNGRVTELEAEVVALRNEKATLEAQFNNRISQLEQDCGNKLMKVERLQASICMMAELAERMFDLGVSASEGQPQDAVAAPSPTLLTDGVNIRGVAVGKLKQAMQLSGQTLHGPMSANVVRTQSYGTLVNQPPLIQSCAPFIQAPPSSSVSLVGPAGFGFSRVAVGPSQVLLSGSITPSTAPVLVSTSPTFGPGLGLQRQVSR